MFVGLVMSKLRSIDLDKHPQLDEVLYPAKVTGVIQPYLVGVPMTTWVPAVGQTIGELFEDSILASLARLGPRWVSIAEHEPDPAGQQDETTSVVRYDQLIKSAPIDRAVAFGLTGRGVAEPVGSTTTESLAKTAPQHLRPVEYAWQGASDRSLWNWVRVSSPVDATAEDVAATLWKHVERTNGEPASYFAYGITAVPPLFGIPASWARSIPGAKEHAPDTTTDDSQGARYLALAQSSAGDPMAIAQANAKPAVAPPHVAQVVETVRDLGMQARYLVRTLTPWKQADGPQVLIAWLERKQRDVATMSPGDLATWASIFDGQNDRLRRIGGGVAQVTGAATTLGVSGPDAPNAGPLVELLDTYSRAAAVSHLHDTAEELLARAAHQQGALATRGVRGTANTMIATIDATRGALLDDDRRRLEAEAQQVADASRIVQDKLAAGAQVDEADVDEVTLHAREITFETKLMGLLTQTRVLRTAADSAGEGRTSHFAAHFHGRFKDLQTALDTISNDVGGIVEVWHGDVDAFDKYDNAPADRERRRRELRHDRLARAEKEFDAFRANSDAIDFLKEGSEIIKWQIFAKACVDMLALLAISVATMGAGTLVAGELAAAFATTEGAAAAAELSAGARLVVGATRVVTTAGLDAGAQVLIQGGDFSDQFLENLLIHGGSAIFERLGKELSLAKEVEKRSAGLWGKVGGAGKAILKEGVAIGLHTVSGVALSYVAHMIVTRKVSAQSMELREWFLQGAAIAIGRHTHDLISSKLPLHQKLVGIPELPVGDLDRLDAELLKLSQRAQEAPKPEDPFDILERRAHVLDREIAAFDKLEADPALLERAKLNSPELARLALASRTERADVGHANLEDLAIAASGLKELVPDRVYSGTGEQIKDLLAHAKRIGLGVESSQEFDHSWDIDLGTKKIQIRVAEGGKPVAASELEGSRAIQGAS